MKKVMFLFSLISSFVSASEPTAAISYTWLQNLLKDNFLKIATNDFTEIQTLCLNECNLDKFSEKLILLETLYGLDISNNPLNNLPDNIDLLKNLQILIIRNTSIESLPSSFKNLPLTRFCFSQTPLMNIFKFKNFEINTIQNLPEDLKKYGTYHPSRGCVIIDEDKKALILSETNIPGPNRN
jgi:Leucine-rich repeat (LRR) protein